MFAKLLGLLLTAAVVAAVVARGSAGSRPEQLYVVKPTDTLWSIASSHYAGDPREGVWKLEKRNHLAGALITPGQRLYIPRLGCPAIASGSSITLTIAGSPDARARSSAGAISSGRTTCSPWPPNARVSSWYGVGASRLAICPSSP